MPVISKIALVLGLLLSCVSTVEGSVASIGKGGRQVIKALDHSVPARPSRVLEAGGASIAELSRTSLRMAGHDLQSNIQLLVDKAIAEKRLSEIKAISIKPKYVEISYRGDFALLECLKVENCPLDRFSELANKVGPNQLHLQVAATCPDCNVNNIYKLSGNINEHVMDSFYQRSGWAKIEGEIGNSGIDGLYIKTGEVGGVTDVLIVEAKYNTSPLSETMSGTQMSKQWITENVSKLQRRADSIDDADNANLYAQIQKFVDAGSYRSQLWRMNVDEDKLIISREKVSSKGRGINTQPLTEEVPWNSSADGTHVIDILQPQSKFDQEVLEDYSEAISRSRRDRAN